MAMEYIAVRPAVARDYDPVMTRQGAVDRNIVIVELIDDIAGSIPLEILYVFSAEHAPPPSLFDMTAMIAQIPRGGNNLRVQKSETRIIG